MRKPRQRRLPDVRTDDDCRRLIATLQKPVYRGCFTLLYAYGLRIGEVRTLPVTAVDSKQLLLRVIGKGNVTATPDYVVLFRPGPEADGDAIHSGLEALIDGLVDEVRTLSGVELGLERRQEGEVGLLVLDANQVLPAEAGMSLTTARDQTRFFLRLERLLPRRHRAYALSLLRSIVPSRLNGRM